MIKMNVIWHLMSENDKRQVIPRVTGCVLGWTIILLFYALPGLSQSQNWQLDTGSPPEIHVTGTSTLHDWKATCSGIRGIPETLTITDKNTIVEFGFKIPVDSMDGGRGTTMNNKIRNAFKSTENPFVNYRQTEPAVVSKIAADGSFDITSKGILSLAGKEKPITVLSKGMIKNGLITLTGTQELKMSDFEMEPPSAMFGQIKTHNDIAVHFELHYKLTGNE